jgi:integrase
MTITAASAGFVDWEIPLKKLFATSRAKYIEQTEFLVAEMNRFGDYLIASVCLLAIDCGLTLEEIVGLQWQDVDLENRLVRAQVNEATEARLISLSDRTIKNLQLWQGSTWPDNYLAFPSLDGETAAGRIRGSLKRYIKRVRPPIYLDELLRKFGISDVTEAA